MGTPQLIGWVPKVIICFFIRAGLWQDGGLAAEYVRKSFFETAGHEG